MKGKQYECKMITGSSTSAAVYVADGTKCDTNKICVNRRCVQMPPNKCPVSSVNGRICSGNGICNSKSKCECDVKWTGSKCDYLMEDLSLYKSNMAITNQTANRMNNEAAMVRQQNLNSTILFSIIAGVTCVLLLIAVCVMLFYRRRIKQRSTPTKTKIMRNLGSALRSSKRMSAHMTMDDHDGCCQMDYDRADSCSSIKFGNLPSYREYKINKTKQQQQQLQQTPATNSIKSNSSTVSGDVISMSKLNNAIKQLSTKPNRGILKKPGSGGDGDTDSQNGDCTTMSQNGGNANQQQHYEEIGTLNDTFTNTNANRQISQIGITIYSNVKRPYSATLSGTSSSSSSSSDVDDDNDDGGEWKAIKDKRRKSIVKQSNSSSSIQRLTSKVEQPPIAIITQLQSQPQPQPNHEFSKVQDYLNELNLLSKQNSFRRLNPLPTASSPIVNEPITIHNDGTHKSQSHDDDLALLEEENKKMSDMVNLLLSPTQLINNNINDNSLNDCDGLSGSGAGGGGGSDLVSSSDHVCGSSPLITPTRPANLLNDYTTVNSVFCNNPSHHPHLHHLQHHSHHHNRHDTMNTLNTNASETSSGYASSATGSCTTNSNNQIIGNLTIKNGMNGSDNHRCSKISQESLGGCFGDEEYGIGSVVSQFSDKRYSYLLATGSTNNLDIDV